MFYWLASPVLYFIFVIHDLEANNSFHSVNKTSRDLKLEIKSKSLLTTSKSRVTHFSSNIPNRKVRLLQNEYLIESGC